VKLEFISSSENKRQEIDKVSGQDYELVRVEADLPEIQSLELREIITAKLQAAQQLFPGRLIIVEDTSFEVDALNGLPGPFIKFFQKQVDDQGVYEMARGRQPEGELRARAKVTIGLVHDGNIRFFEGKLEGQIVEQEGEGWGFDRILIPDDYHERLDMLGPEIKSKISHRAAAARRLKVYLDSLEHN